MAISSYNARLMKGSGSGGTITWTKLIDVKTTPQLGGAPELLETTTLSDSAQTYINGIQSTEAMTFVANYSSADYDSLKLLENQTNDYAVWFGNNGDGAEGKFKFKGQLSVFINETSVNSVVEMTITIVPTTVITRDTAA
jgi:hypothetical protein